MDWSGAFSLSWRLVGSPSAPSTICSLLPRAVMGNWGFMLTDTLPVAQNSFDVLRRRSLHHLVQDPTTLVGACRRLILSLNASAPSSK